MAEGEAHRDRNGAGIAVQAFGSSQARELLNRWRDALAVQDEERMRAAHDAMVDIARHELGTQLLQSPD